MIGRSPITVSYLQGLKKNHKSFSMFEEQLELLDELIKRTHHIDCSRSMERMRCFFIIETMYSYIIPRVLDDNRVGATMVSFHPDDEESPFSNTGKPVDRSWTGLGKLLEHLTDLADHCEVMATELQLLNKEAGSASRMVTDRLGGAKETIDNTRKAVQFFRPHLRDDRMQPGLWKLGEMLATAVTVKPALSMEKQINIAHDLMTISLEDPKVPCHRMNESQE